MTGNDAPTNVAVLHSEQIGHATWMLTQQTWGIAPDTYEVAVADRRPGQRHRFTVIGTYRGYDSARDVFDVWTRIERERFA